jgi:hypothetical protein
VKRITLGAVLVLALAVAGCGGGGNALSKAEYSAKLNQICKDLNAKNKEIGEPNSLDELVAKGPQLADEFQTAIDKAKKLKPPAELKDAADRFISLSQQIHDKIDGLLDAAKKKDAKKLDEIGSSIDPLDKESNQIARNQLGAPACTQG